MPRIPDRVSNCALYLYKTREAALAGERGGATAFCTYLPAENPTLRFFNGAHFYVVTARHVIGGGGTFLRVNTRQDRPAGVAAGPADVVEIPAESWVPHPDGDDVTVSPLILELDENVHDVRGFPWSIAATPDDVRDENIGRGDEAFFIGRFMGADGGARNEPSVRFGNIAMLPTPIRSETGIMQESFLVEARSIGGYSGSPVFTYKAGVLTDTGEVDPYASSKLRFLGVDWCHLPDWQPVMQDDKRTPVVPPQWARGNTGMAGVVPAWKVTQLLQEPILEKSRKDDEAERLREVGAPEAVSDMEADDEFGHFENLTRKLVNTPKTEIDEKRKGDS